MRAWTSSAVPVTVVDGSSAPPVDAHAARSASLRWMQWPTWTSRWRSSSGRSSITASHSLPPGRSGTASRPYSSYVAW